MESINLKVIENGRKGIQSDSKEFRDLRSKRMKKMSPTITYYRTRSDDI